MDILTAVSLTVPICLEAGIVALLIRRKLQTRFPLFLTYLVYEILELILRLIFSRNEHVYFQVYWSTSALATIFTFLAVQENFLNTLRVYAQLRWFRWLFWICVILSVLYSIAKAVLQPPVEASFLLSLAILGELTLEYLVIAAVLLYFGLIYFFNIKKHKYESGVLLGFFGCFSLSNFAFVARSAFGTRFASFSKWLPAVAYIIGAVTWLVVFSRSEPQDSRPLIDLEPDQAVTDLQQYPWLIAKMRAFLRRR